MGNKVLVSTLLLAITATPAFAQNEALLKDYFEGRRVVVRMDMPGTKDGVNVFPESRRDVNLAEYRNNLRRFGPAIRAGETAMVTLVKVKNDLIEFQLDGGGFGTFFDDTSTTAYIPLLDKSNRERELERRVRDEDNRYRRSQLQRELNDLRDRRERENSRIRYERERISEYKRERVAVQRVNGGSRFNIRFNGRVPYDLRPEDIMAALSEYLDFRGRGGIGR